MISKQKVLLPSSKKGLPKTKGTYFVATGIVKVENDNPTLQFIPEEHLKEEEGYFLTKNELVNLLKETFDEGVSFASECINEESKETFDSKFQNVTSKETITAFIKKKLK